jgi:hypothetical protein
VARVGSKKWHRAWRRETRLLTRVKGAAWRREMAELERTGAIASAHAEGVSIRKIATAAGLGATRVTTSRPSPRASMSVRGRW